MVDHFLSCDWGTSSFRLKLVAVPGLQVVSGINDSRGIASVFNQWEKKGATSQLQRQFFYFEILAEYIAELERKADRSLTSVPIVLSGMASSTIGIIDIPYTDIPFEANGKDLQTRLIKKDEKFPHDVLIISGARTGDDVMRGEETQLIGCLDDMEMPLQAKQLFIFPGTHSKHIFVESRKIVSFTTYMTGEFFALLSGQSILHNAVKEYHNESEPSSSFLKGVKDAADANLLHIAFMVRTNDLFGKMTKEQNYDYLSGLLIGSELKELITLNLSIFLCCNSNLEKYYRCALTALGLDERVKVFPPEKIDGSVIKGQFKILQYKGL